MLKLKKAHGTGVDPTFPSQTDIDKEMNGTPDSFFIPAFRIKHDVVPGRYGFAWVNPTVPGDYRLYCAEYCGEGHSLMRRDVQVHDKSWDAVMREIEWKYDDGSHSLWENGQHLYQIYCSGCHSIDGTPKTGPSFKDSWGNVRETDKGSITMDENYVRESIEYPNAVVVNGYPKPSPMPSFLGRLPKVKNDDGTESDIGIDSLIEFLKDPSGEKQKDKKSAGETEGSAEVE